MRIDNSKIKVKLALSLLAALLLSLPWLGAGSYSVLVGLVPLLIISASYDRGRSGFWKTFGWVALGLGLYSGITTWWIWYAAPIGAILSVLITVGLFGGVFMVYHWTSKRVPRPLAYTLLVTGWISAEYLYTVGEVSFPWLMLGNGFAGDVKLVQWYDTLGMFGGSLWVLVVNLAIFTALTTVTARRKRGWIVATAIIVIPITISLIKYYTYSERGENITVTVVQPNIDPYIEKFVLPQETQTNLMLSLCEQAPSGVDFIVLPETAINEGIWENVIEENHIIGEFRGLLQNKYPDAQVIIGATSMYLYAGGEKHSQTARSSYDGSRFYDIYNTAMTIDTHSEVQMHHKTKLVIGVEKMPYMTIVKLFESLIVDLGGTVGQLGVSEKCRSFSSPSGISSGAPICYEGIYGQTIAEFVQNGAEVLFIISNDGWWGDTQGHRHLFSFSRLRAIENRRAIGRSANTGTSGFINQRGDVLQRVGWDIETTLTDTLTANDHLTFYTRYGDIVARISVYVFALSVLCYIALSYRRRNHT